MTVSLIRTKLVIYIKFGFALFVSIKNCKNTHKKIHSNTKKNICNTKYCTCILKIIEQIRGCFRLNITVLYTRQEFLRTNKND